MIGAIGRDDRLETLLRMRGPIERTKPRPRHRTLNLTAATFSDSDF
jgi:hypothetical protein